MSLVTLNDILPQARAQKRSVCAFNVVNCESASAVLKAAESTGQPVIMQVFHRLFNDEKAERVAAVVRKMADASSVPIVLHLDHGVSLQQVQQAVEYGFSSVMFDGSKMPQDENISLTREAVAYAHKHGLSVEGEIGHVPATQEDAMQLSTPQEAERFVEETQVDALAVAIGTSHGFYKKAPEIDLDRARAISNAVGIPLVLHGGSGTPVEKVQALIQTGFAKVNVATEFQDRFLKLLKAECQEMSAFLPIDLFMQPVVDQTAEYVRGVMEQFAGQSNLEQKHS